MAGHVYAAAAGVELRPHCAVLELLTGVDGAAVGAALAPETVAAARTVLCAGAWSAALARPLGIEPALRPTAVKLADARLRHSLPALTSPHRLVGIFVQPG